MNFANVKGLTIPQGKVTKIELLKDSMRTLLWQAIRYLKGYTIGGNAEVKDGRIVGVGDYDSASGKYSLPIVASSRNMLLPDNVEIGRNYNGSYNVKRAYYYMPMKAGTYTISAVSVDGLSECVVGKASQIYGDRVELVAFSSSTKSTTKTFDGSMGLLIFVIANDATMTQSIWDSCKFQIEEGTTASEYTHHESTTYPLLVSSPLYKVGSVADVAKFGEGVAREYMKVKLGDALSVVALTNNRFRFNFVNGTMMVYTKAGEPQIPSFLCSAYTASRMAEFDRDQIDKTIRQSDDAGRAYVILRDTSYADVDAIKEAVKDVELIYRMATPTTEAVDLPKIVDYQPTILTTDTEVVGDITIEE